MAREDITVKFNLDDSGFKGGIKRATGAINGFGKSALGAANKLAKMGFAAAAAGVALLVRNAIQLGSELSDIAISTGFATEEFQVFRGALIEAGGDAKSMEKAILIMQKAVVQGSEGLTTYVRAFERLGLNVDDLRAMKPEDQFKTIGKAIAGAADQQGALTAAIEIFGQRNAPRLIEVFKRLDEDGYGKMAEDIESAFGIMSAETQAALDKAADSIEKFKSRATIFVGDLISGDADGAAIKALGFKLMAVLGRFGGGLIDFLVDAASGIQAGFGAAFDLVSLRLKSGIETAILTGLLFLAELKTKAAELNPFASVEESSAAMTEQLNLEKKINAIQKKRAEENKKSFADLFAERVNGESKVAEENAAFWNAKADEQERLLEISRAEFKLAQDEKEAARKAIRDAMAGGGSGSSGDGSTTPGSTDEVPDDGGDLERQKKLMDMKLAALKAETRGEDALAEALRNRIKLAERILEIMNKTGATKREATIIANKQIKAELSGGGSSGESTGSSEGNSTGGSTGGRSNQPSDIVRGNIRTGRITSVGLGTRESRFGPTPTMDERERAAGLTLAGNNTMRGRASTGAGGKAGDEGAATGKADNLPQEQLSVLKSIELEIKKNP